MLDVASDLVSWQQIQKPQSVSFPDFSSNHFNKLNHGEIYSVVLSLILKKLPLLCHSDSTDKLTELVIPGFPPKNVCFTIYISLYDKIKTNCI